MAVNVEDVENILVAVLSGDNLEIYNALTNEKNGNSIWRRWSLKYIYMPMSINQY